MELTVYLLGPRSMDVAKHKGRGRSASIAGLINDVKKSLGFLVVGPKGSGKTSLLSEISNHFNSPGRVMAIGPLSLRLVNQKGLDALGSELLNWVLQVKITRVLYSELPTHPASLDNWLAFLNRLISLLNAHTLLLLLDDLDSIPPKDRQAVLQNILKSSLGKTASRTVLGCAGSVAENEVSSILGGALGRGRSSEVPVILRKESAVELLNALVSNLGSVPQSVSWGSKRPGKGYSYEYEGEIRAGSGPNYDRLIEPPDNQGGGDRTEYRTGGKSPGPEGSKIAGQEGSRIAGQEGSKISGQEGSKIVYGPPLEVHEQVDCTVYAPLEVSPGSGFLVQVFAHLPHHAPLLEEIAKQAAPDARKRGSTTLPTKIKRGAVLTFNLTMPELEIDEPSQSLIWRGRPDVVQFGVAVPKAFKPGDIIARVDVSKGTIPIGRLRFTVKILTEAAIPNIEAVTAKMRRYEQAFISYSSKDRPEVLKRIQMLDELGPKYFMDQVTLKRGEKWEKRIYEYLDKCDVVYLFWSKAARRSPWVKKEIMYAKQRQAGNDEAPPDIVPIPIEGPPIVKPPAELSYLHFNDNFLYFINAPKV